MGRGTQGNVEAPHVLNRSTAGRVGLCRELAGMTCELRIWTGSCKLSALLLILRMDLDNLKTLIEVAKLGSFSRAAEKVLRSQPAVSAQIRQLEQEYGQRLFDRSA